jgi:hypothetical protein
MNYYKEARSDEMGLSEYSTSPKSSERLQTENT